MHSWTANDWTDNEIKTEEMSKYNIYLKIYVASFLRISEVASHHVFTV